MPEIPSSTWPVIPLGSLAADEDGAIAIGPFGSSLKAEVYTTIGIPVVRGNNLTDSPGFHGDFVYIDERTAARFPRCIVRPGDIVFPHRGAIGEVGLAVGPAESRWMLSTSMMKFRCDNTKLDAPYLYYFFRSAFGRHQLLRNASQVGTPGIGQPLASLRACEIPTPPLREQRAIAGVLGALDDKIESNRRTSRTLERVARTIFRAWFVDFAPVKAKAAELIRNAVLEIGDGYRAKNSEMDKCGLPFIRAGNLNNGFDTARAERLCEESVAKAGRKVSRVGDIAFTSKGTVGRFARVTAHTERFVYSPQICYWRSLDPSQLDPAILYCWMQDDDFGAQIAAVAGQTDMAPYVSLKDQRQMSVPVFPSSQHTVAPKIEALLARQSAAIQESKILVKLRDYLLPKLLSGEVRVAEGPVCSILETTAASRKKRRGHA